MKTETIFYVCSLSNQFPSYAWQHAAQNKQHSTTVPETIQFQSYSIPGNVTLALKYQLPYKRFLRIPREYSYVESKLKC